MRIALCLAAAVAGVGLAVGAAGATASPALAGSGRYVAMGSSYAAGPGIAPGSGACGRSGRNYANLVASARGLTLVDVACDGATAANIITSPQRLRNGTLPLQIDAVTADTTLVTITVGGNDIGYMRALIGTSMCQAGLNAGSGRPCKAVAAPPQSDYDKVTASLVRVVAAVKQRAPKAEVLLVDYLPVLDAAGGGCAKMPLTADQQAPLERMYTGVVAATARAAHRSGAQLIQSSAAGAAHTACAPAPWVTGFQLPIPYHPNAAGMSGVAQLVESSLDTKEA